MSIGKFFSMIKFEHSIFALPFAYIGMMLGFSHDINIRVIVLVTIAMISARSSAMALNRIIDRHIDEKNARTKGRELPSGKIGLHEAYAFTLLSIVIFELSVYYINNLAFMLSPIALFFMFTYSYTKRFTYLSHFYLGATDAIAPLGGYVAAANAIVAPIFFIAVFVMFWIGGFDILYALQDIDFDREHKLYSIPSVFGVKPAITAAAVSHVIAFLSLIIGMMYFNLNIFSIIGLLIVAILFIYEHKLIDPRNIKKINIAFFNINSYISIVLLFTFFVGIYL